LVIIIIFQTSDYTQFVAVSATFCRLFQADSHVTQHRTQRCNAFSRSTSQPMEAHYYIIRTSLQSHLTLAFYSIEKLEI